MTLFALIPLIAGIGFLVAALYYALQFYPPGYDYGTEKRNNRRAGRFATAGLIILAASTSFMFH